MSAKLFGEIAKFFSGGKSGPKALLMAYAKFGKDAVNKYFKERQPSYNMKIDNKNIGGMVKKHHGGMVKRRAGVAKRGFNNFKGIF
tara:strand:+ start:283 stop:540 length:258 start_codon:yes stop_codon:yes gene_type:complete